MVLCVLVSGCMNATADSNRPVTPTVERIRDKPIVATDESRPWRAIHAGMCCGLPFNGGFRVWYTGRESTARPFQICRADFDGEWNLLADELCIPASTDTFDGAGAFMPCVIECEGQLRMYYAAHQSGDFPGPGSSAAYADSSDGGVTWTKRGQTIKPDGADHFGVGTHCVFRDGEKWRMVYTHVEGVRPNMRYYMKYAVSDEGIVWERPANNVALDLDNGTVARPCVWKHGQSFLMVYTYNERYRPESGRDRKTYRIRWADSRDGMHFTDRGQILDVAKSGWDSQMVCYGWAVPDRGLLLYTGNRFGQGGFGVAQLHLQ